VPKAWAHRDGRLGARWRGQHNVTRTNAQTHKHARTPAHARKSASTLEHAPSRSRRARGVTVHWHRDDCLGARRCGPLKRTNAQSRTHARKNASTLEHAPSRSRSRRRGRGGALRLRAGTVPVAEGPAGFVQNFCDPITTRNAVNGQVRVDAVSLRLDYTGVKSESAGEPREGRPEPGTLSGLG
jgi:hypothetical protein